MAESTDTSIEGSPDDARRLADLVRRERVGNVIAACYRDMPQTSADDGFALASAVALTEAESW